MSASSRSRSSVPAMKSGLKQSISPAGRFYSSAFSASAPPSNINVFATSSTSFSARSTSNFLTRSSSPTRVNLIGSSPPSSSVRFSIDRPISPGRSISAITSRDPVIRPPISAPGRRKTCMCSPTTHPGSFRCSLHKGVPNRQTAAVSSPSNRLNARRSAMTNSLVRIGTVEGELVKRALAALIRPSSHHQRRRADFRPRPSRLSKMSIAEDL
ncbi:uncharacterized protein LOC110094081 [Dendrobium catenatum]|uniref:Serine-rich protein-like protein n=1 Tax=Dendrobium catenatum TaxID=906689 RepID=A0A2I0XBS4_9ASPA|nr:uncharacterized protein LOC110094081 [Dendrobium catenatum]PKU85362.1 hypothetical protein MA16_Dca003101 [Dendrobium catenatum]